MIYIVPHARSAHRQALRIGSLLRHDRVKGVARFTFTANLRLYPSRGTPGKDGGLIVRLQPPFYKNFGCKKHFVV